MPGAKYGITDENFLPKMIEQCEDDEERALVYLLFYTGMHGSCLRALSTSNLKREGDAYYIRWVRTKTGRTMEAPLPSRILPIIEPFLLCRKKSLVWYNTLLKRIGTRAGFDGVSTMTFRHTRTINLVRQGVPLPVIAQVMGCSQDIIVRNYGKLSETQMREILPGVD